MLCSYLLQNTRAVIAVKRLERIQDKNQEFKKSAWLIVINKKPFTEWQVSVCYLSSELPLKTNNR